MPLHKSSSGIGGSSGAGSGALTSASLSSLNADGKSGAGAGKASYSKVVEGLTHSQGSIALISALLAGFAFQALTTLDITYEELEGERKAVYVCFAVTACFTIASFLYIAVACSMLEQNGLVARSLAVSPMTGENFDDVVRHWYFDDQDFVQFRGRLIGYFHSSFVLFAAFAALYCPLRLSQPATGCACGGIFVLFGAVIFVSNRRMNSKFVNGILKRV